MSREGEKGSGRAVRQQNWRGWRAVTWRVGKGGSGGSEDGKGGERWEGGGDGLARLERNKANELGSWERCGEGVVRSLGSGKGARVVTWQVGKGWGMGARR